GLVLLTGLGDVAAAGEHLAESVRLCRVVGSDWTLASALAALGIVDHARMDPARARDHHGQALPIFEDLADGYGANIARAGLALVDTALREETRAARRWSEGVAGFVELGNTDYAAICLVGVAVVCALGSRHVPAARLLGAADGLSRPAGYTYFDAILPGLRDRTAGAARRALGDGRFAAFEAGRAPPPRPAVPRAPPR